MKKAQCDNSWSGIWMLVISQWKLWLPVCILTLFHFHRYLWNLSHWTFLSDQIAEPVSSAARKSKTHGRAAAVFLDRAAPNRLLPWTPSLFPAKHFPEHRTLCSLKAVESIETWSKRKLPQGVHRWQRKTEFEYHLQFRSQCLYNLPLQCLAESCWEKERNIKRGLIQRLAPGYLLAC